MAWGILVIAMLLWSSSFIAAKMVLVDFSPEQAVALRLGIAAVISLPWLLTWGRPLIKTLNASHWKWLLLMSFFEPCLYFLAEMNGLLYTSASAASLVTSTMPLWVVIGAWFLLKESIGRNTIIGIALAVGGTIVMTVFGQTSEAAPDPLLGNLLMLAATLFATGYILVAKKLTDDLNPWIVTILQLWVGALFFLPFLIYDMPNFSQVSDQGWGALLWLGGVVSIGAYGFYNLGISKVPAQIAGVSINLIPLFTLIMAAVILDERLSTLEWTGGGLILIGILFAAWPSPSTKTTASVP